jgi:putative transposase
MNTIFRTYKFELQPTQEQKVLLDKHFGCIRYVYNHFLNERKEQYQENNKSDNYYKQAATLTELKKKEETVWLKEVNSQSLQFALRCLDTAYLNFFRGKAMFPRFKSKKNKNTFTVPQFVALEENKLYIPKFKEGLKIITSSGTGDNTGGDTNKTLATKHKSVKPEAQSISIAVGG